MKIKLNHKQKKNIFLFSIITIALVILSIIMFTTSPTLIKHNEKNTYEVRGIVTDFEYTAPIYFGQKIRQPHIIHLDNGTDCPFYYYNYEIYYQDPDQENIKDELVGQYVVIRLSKINDSVITIETDKKCYLSFEASNMQHNIGIIGIALFDFSVLFTAFVVLINPIINDKKRSRKR